MMSGKYQKEQLEIEARLKEVTETLNESYEKSRGIRDFLALIRNYQGLKELDATVINALIDKILVSEREKMADGTVKQEIKIYYKFIGFVDELHIIPTKRWAAMPAKIVRCAALNMSRALVHQGIVLLVPRRYGGRNQTRANAGAENRKDSMYELSAKMTD